MSKSIIKKVSPFIALIIICFIVFVEVKSINSNHDKPKKETKQEIKVNKDIESTDIKEPVTAPKVNKETPKTNGSTTSPTDKKAITDTSSTVTSDQSTTTDTSLNNTTQTTTPSTDTTTSTTNTTTTTTSVKVLYANGKLVGKGDEVQLTRSPFSIKILDNGKQTGGYQGEYSETITFTVKDENGNLLDTPSKPSDYGTIQTLTYTPAIQGQGTIQQSAALSYKALVLNDGSGNLVMGNTSKVTFEAVPAQGWKFQEWKVATYTETNPKLTYGFSETQKITGNDYITAIFVQDTGTN